MKMKIPKERIYKALNEKNSVQRYLARRVLFPILEPLGFHIVGNHFYEPIPDLRELRKNYHKDAPRTLPNIVTNFEQAEVRHTNRLSQYGDEFYTEVERFGYPERNPYFPASDAISLYCFLRENRPTHVVEVGQGLSTLVSLAALSKNWREDSKRTRFISIDPYDRLPGTLRNLDGVEVKIIHRAVQSVEPEELAALIIDRSLLFVDSSHVFKPGSDVEYLMGEIYPRVSKNSYIHIHDIHTPYPWPLEFYLENKWFWNEQDHLESFLNFNGSFRVELPLFWLLKDSMVVNEHLRKYLRTDPGLSGSSFFIQRTR
jgi:hypothetical protein